jgi:hypothetical protein
MTQPVVERSAHRDRFPGENFMRHGRSLVRALSIAVASTLAVTALSLVAGPSTAATTGGIAGVVTGPGDTPLDNVSATAFWWNPAANAWQGTGRDDATDADGAYEITGLEAGTYRVRFWDYSSHHYLTEFWDNAATVESAADVSVVADTTTADIDAELGEGGHITGTVTGPLGDAAAGVMVWAYRWNAQRQNWQQVEHAYTTPDGDYDIDQLQTGVYRLEFHPEPAQGYGIEFWDDAANVLAATDVHVSAGETTSGRDAELSAIGHITGTVTAPGDVALAGILVNAYRLVPEQGWIWDGTATTRADGKYDVQVRTEGPYRLWIADQREESAYLSEYWDDSATIDGATNVLVASGTTVTGKDAELAPASLSDTPQVGSSVEADAADWSEAGLAVQYQWLVGGAVVPGATGASYTPAGAEVGKSLQVQVTTGSGPLADSARSAAVTVRKGVLTSVRKSRVAGTLQRGKTLRLALGTWSAPASTTVRWYAGSKRVATGLRLRLRLRGKVAKAVAGKKVTVRITASSAGYEPVTTTLKVKGKLKRK